MSNPGKKEQDLIDALKADLTPITSPAPMLPVLSGWLLASVVYVAAACLLLGPYRPGFVEQLLTVPRFSIEMLMGFAAVVCFALVALAESIPGIDVRRVRRSGWVLAVGWLSQFLVGLEFPTLELSMLGKREHCLWEAYVYSVPPLLAMVWLQRRRFALQPLRAIGYAALAAGMIPALIMQIACMYDARHILQFHVLPVAILTVVAVVVGYFRARR